MKRQTFVKDSLSKEISLAQDSIKLFLVSSKSALLARKNADEELEKNNV